MMKYQSKITSNCKDKNMIDVVTRMREAIFAINPITVQSNILNCRMYEPAYPSSRESLYFTTVH